MFNATQLALQTPVRVVFTTVLVAVSYPGLQGNIFSLIVLFRIKTLSETAQISMISMAFANLGIGVFAALPGVVSAAMGKWPFGDTLCSLQAMLFQVMLFASTWSLFIMSVDRYIAISRPLRYHQIVNRSKGITATVVCWCIACAGGFLLGPFQRDFRGAAYAPSECCCKFGFTGSIYGIILLILAFLPISFSNHLYIRIGLIARAQAKKIQASIPDNPVANANDKRNSAYTTLLLVGLAFDFGILPFIIINAVEIRNPQKNIAMFCASFICRALFYAYSFACLIIYNKRNKAFKKETDKLFKGKCSTLRHIEEE